MSESEQVRTMMAANQLSDPAPLQDIYAPGEPQLPPNFQIGGAGPSPAPTMWLPPEQTQQMPDIQTIESYTRPINPYWAVQRAQVDALLKGHTEEFQKDVDVYLQNHGETIEDEALLALEKYYADSILEDQGVLDGLEELSEPERIERLVYEYNRIDAQKLELRELVAINMLRQGLGSNPGKYLDEITYNITPTQAQALRNQRVRAMNEEFNRIIDRMAAREGVGFTTGVAVGEILQQDAAPLWGAATRILGTNKFLPEDADIGTLRRGFPGEIRQEIREWWIQATPDARRQYLEDLDRELDRIRKSDTSGIYTHYLFVENFMGIFTENMLQDNNATDTFDRVMGNLDTGLGFLVGAGLFIRRGKSIAELFTSGRKNVSKHLAMAGGSRQADEALDAQIQDLAKELGMSTDQAALPQLAKPKQLELDLDGLDVELDTVKHTTVANTERRKRILDYLDESDSVLIDNDAKRDAVKRVIDDLNNRDTVHLHHKMSTVRGLPNGTGVEIDAIVGSRGGEGWVDLSELLSDMREMDPYQDFTIVRRNAKGKAEEIEVTWPEIVEYYARGRVPDSMRPYIEPLSPEATEFERFFGGRPIHKVSMDELKSALDGDWVPADSPMYDWIREEIRARNAKGVDALDPDPLLALNGEEFFAKFKTTHYFNPQDMQNIDGFRYFDIPGIQSSVRFIGRLFPPNTKFGKLYEAASKSYHMEEAALTEFADMLTTFDNLSPQRKRNAMEMIEWAEDYAKDMYHETGVARAPTVEELIGEFSHFDDKTFEGFLAHREAMDGLYDVLNRRLYRDFTNRGAVTIRSRDDMLPNYHGLPMRTDAPPPKGDAPDTRFVPGQYYDPVRREMVELTAEDIADLIDQGGGAIKLDFAVDMPGGGRTTRILARPGEYEIGALSNRVLNKYEGYNFRFYEDPYFIVKRNYGATVDGVKIADDEYVEEAVRTASSQADARRFLGKMREQKGGEYVDTRNPRERFVIQRAKDINATEGRLYQKQALHREGRLFWDQRAHERLPDTTGNLAKVADPFQAMQKGLAMALRQTTQEGLFDGIKVGFMNEFAHLPLIKERGGLITMEELADLERDLVKAKNASTGNLRRDYRSAIEYVRYMRNQLGTDTWAVPALRAFSLNILEWLDSYTKGTLRGPLGFLQKHAMQMDPFARARKIAYGAFMVLRPARQLVLQSMQISMLTGLAPTYIGSGKIFVDALGLRRGLTRYRRAGFDDGWSDASIAKAMGLKKKEYKRLVEEFQRSGLMGSVNTHAFNASGRNLSANLDPKAGPLGRMAYNARARGRQVFNAMARGFEIGEQNNLTFSYLLGLRRIKAKYKITDLTKMSRQQWDEVMSEADSLALAMTRPNKFAYQTGATGTLFQFLSFQHRALLTFMGLNPKLTAKDAMWVLGGNYVLWGTHMFGADTFIEETLAQNGLSLWGQTEVAKGVSIQDLLISGVVDVGLNLLMREMDDKHNNLDFGVLAPGGNIADLYSNFYDLVTSSPVDMEYLGPFANQANGFMQGLALTRAHVANQYMPPEQKFLQAAKAFGQNIIPQLNDLQTTWVAAQMNEWVTKSNDPLGIQPHVSDMVARGVMGLRTDEELSIYRARQKVWENEEAIDDWVKTWRPVLRNIVSSWKQGEYSSEQAFELASMVHSLTEDAPEGIRREIYKRLMTSADSGGKSINQLIAEAAATGSMNIAQLIPHIEKSSMTPQQKQMMIDFVRQVQDGYVGADEKYREMIESELDNRVIE